jgi:hypothetical protein
MNPTHLAYFEYYAEDRQEAQPTETDHYPVTTGEFECSIHAPASEYERRAFGASSTTGQVGRVALAVLGPDAQAVQAGWSMYATPLGGGSGQLFAVKKVTPNDHFLTLLLEGT